MLKSINNIIAIASGKGGVGKSTVSANLACALQLQGNKVGILDADIYGPSQAALFGIEQNVRPQTAHNKYFVPIKAHNISLMSMAFLLDEKTPVIWRAPMANGALLQMLNQTMWGDLDYLLIDLPPGTGDIALTLAQKANLTGAIIITTPQKLSILDAQKALEMFIKTKTPILGVVENMASHICPNCEHVAPIFASGGGQKMADLYNVPMLGSLPLLSQFNIDADVGTPSVVANSNNIASKIYLELATKIDAINAKLKQNSSNKTNKHISVLNL